MSDTLLLNADGTPLTLVPLSAIRWQSTLRLLYLDKVKVLKEYDNWAVRSQHLDLKVPSIVIMSKQVKYRKGLKYSRNNVYLRDDFVCQLQITNRCQELHGKVKLTELTIDHVVPSSHGGSTKWTNVCTSCKECNSKKGNDASIVPKKAPYQPSYYEILAKRKKMPIYIRDAEWALYLGWNSDLIKVLPEPNSGAPAPDDNLDDLEFDYDPDPSTI